MEILSNENIIKLLYFYNTWWKNGEVDPNLNKPKKRFAFYEAKRGFLHEDIKRAILLSGARRTGKTTIMYQMIDYLIKEKKESPKRILFISFDHPLLKMCTMDKVLEIYQQNVYEKDDFYCFFDEIQYADDWNTWIKILYDTMPNIRIMATGSASPILNDKVQSESGLGRWKTILVPTLSFYEYCDLLDITKPDIRADIKPTQMYQLSIPEQTDIFMKLSKLQTHFLRYLQVGGFPELALSKDDIYAERVLREDIVDKAIKRDLPSIYGIRNINDIEKIFLYICYNSSNIINIDSISKELTGVSRPTVEKYISQLESANLIYISKPVELGGKKVLKQQNKIYISDAAMRNAVLMNSDLVLDPDELGIIAETVVYKHIKAFYYNSQVQVGYYRDGSRGKEIDIVVKLPKNNIMIEVKYRENSDIKENDGIVVMSSFNQPNLVITKRDNDFGLITFGDKRIYKLPASAFLYLLGLAEKSGYNNYDI